MALFRAVLSLALALLAASPIYAFTGVGSHWIAPSRSTVLRHGLLKGLDPILSADLLKVRR